MLKQYSLFIILPILTLFLASGCAKNNVSAPTTDVSAGKLSIAEKVEKLKDRAEVVAVSVKDELKPEPKPDPELPARLDLKAPFVSQAPTGNWGLPYQELCEEAAVLSAARYFSGESITDKEANVELLNVWEWEKENLETATDLSLEEVAVLAEKYFNLKVTISEDVSADNIKKQLVAEKIVLVPTAGRLLGSPFYSGLGPIYHFLVIRGYDDRYFITNDVGTRTKGDGYKFLQAVVINAIHDLPKKQDGTYWRLYDSDISDSRKADLIKTGAKRIMILEATK